MPIQNAHRYWDLLMHLIKNEINNSAPMWAQVWMTLAKHMIKPVTDKRSVAKDLEAPLNQLKMQHQVSVAPDFLLYASSWVCSKLTQKHTHENGTFSCTRDELHVDAAEAAKEILREWKKQSRPA